MIDKLISPSGRQSIVRVVKTESIDRMIIKETSYFRPDVIVMVIRRRIVAHEEEEKTHLFYWKMNGHSIHKNRIIVENSHSSFDRHPFSRVRSKKEEENNSSSIINGYDKTFSERSKRSI